MQQQGSRRCKQIGELQKTHGTLKLQAILIVFSWLYPFFFSQISVDPTSQTEFSEIMIYTTCMIKIFTR